MSEGFLYRARKWLLQRVTSNRNATQHELLEDTDWDVLVILDACGAENLRSVAHWPVETAVSPASCTPEWIRECLSSGVLDGSRIVSANPQYEKFDIDASVEPYYETHWDDGLSTVLPEPVLDRVDEVTEGEERVVAHLQQPHWPYVAKLDRSWKLAYSDTGPWEGEGDSTQAAMQRGYIELDEAKQAYRASVHSAWKSLTPYLRSWAEESLTTVVTADHGEAFGEFRNVGMYEHPCGCHLSGLTHVPWVEIRPERSDSKGAGSVEDRLKALGYAE
jgi:hypothetical protein